MSESTRIPPRRKSKGDGQFMFSALILVLVVASLLGMYFYIEDQKNKNSEAVEVIAGKVQNIESKLSITNEDSAQNMDTVTDQISFLDKEVRKLWGHRRGYLENFKNQEKINYYSSRGRERNIEIYYPPDSITFLKINSATISEIPEVKFASLQTFDLSLSLIHI